MHRKLSVTIGQYSEAGRKAINQDYHGACIPREPQLSSKGVAIAIADGISSSDVSQIASQTAVSAFLDDYYCTSDAWSVKTSAQKVLYATNSWLYSQTRNGPHRFNKDKGYVCTFSAMIVKSRTAHIFHCGDARIYRLSGDVLEPLTTDHRHVVSEETSYLTRALGIHDSLELDYRRVPLEEGDIFVLCTDGVHEYIADQDIAQSILKNASDLDMLAEHISQQSFNGGSHDNLTVQILRVNTLPDSQIDEVQRQLTDLALPPKLEPRMLFDGYTIQREIYISSRSHVYLAVDTQTQEKVVIKTPSTELKDDIAYLEGLLMEEWIAKRVNNLHVLKAIRVNRRRKYIYTVSEYVDGQTLSQWIIDNPGPTIDQVRRIVEQIIKGVQAFHRQEMIHQDIRPNNIMIDSSGTVKIIDFGSTKVAGISDIRPNNEGVVGTLQYSAPEYFLSEGIARRADIFSVGVIAYQMLSGHLPFGTKVSSAKNKAAQHRLSYQSLLGRRPDIPEWVDDTIKKAVSVNPLKRYQEISEFSYDLHHPSRAFISKARIPLIERNPVVFWQSLSVLLLLVVLWQTANN